MMVLPYTHDYRDVHWWIERGFAAVAWGLVAFVALLAAYFCRAVGVDIYTARSAVYLLLVVYILYFTARIAWAALASSLYRLRDWYLDRSIRRGDCDMWEEYLTEPDSRGWLVIETHVLPRACQVQDTPSVAARDVP